MLKLTQTIRLYVKSNCGPQFLRNNFSSAPISATVPQIEQENELNTKKADVAYSKLNKEHNSLVAAAFASLKNENKNVIISGMNIDFSNITTVQDLLKYADKKDISRKHALKIVSVLSEWSSSGKVELSDFDSDPRFIKLCRILIRTNGNKKTVFVPRSEDLSTLIHVTADDEAAKLVNSITLAQMVKVIKTLAQRKRRSAPLLRSIAFNIAGSVDHLNIKECADILYSSSLLNFIDKNMVEKICSDISLSIKDDFKSSAVIGSILNSFGHLRYKDPAILDILSDWVLSNSASCRVSDIVALFITLATVNYQPNNLDQLSQVIISQLKESEICKASMWLDFVWSLVVLNQANSEHISSVLTEEFLKKVEYDDAVNIPARLKLLHINSASKLLLQSYNGPSLPNSTYVNSTLISRTKDKLILVSALQDTISNLINLKTHSRLNSYSGMGFYIDVEVMVDKKCNPLPVNVVASDTSNFVKIAVVALDFHDMCKGCVEPNGLNSLHFRLLEASGYKILSVPYTEFNPKDKLVNRVKYIESSLRKLVLD
ncbi:hypothetical protein FQA39_LY06229 [Lamprigera yunnana]|nr:hypothetical protein FQA39_LY06229 [Lamprigera yunnana]